MQSSRSWIIVLILIAGFVLRIAGARSELWLDEITSAQLAISALSLQDLLLNTRIDNNHLLNSAWLYLIRDWAGSAWIWYRIPALLGSALLLILLPTLLRTSSFIERFAASALVALSYIFILYGSEARGYGLMLALGVLAVVVSERAKEANKLRFLAPLFWITCILGFLSQFTFFNFYLPLLLASFWGVFDSKTLRTTAGRLLILHTPVIFIIGVIYVSYVRYLPPGSGELRSYLEVIANLLSLGFGGPEISPSNLEISLVAFSAAIGVLCVLAIEVALLLRERAQRAPIFLLGLIVPVLSLLIVEPRVLYERYLLAPLFFSYLIFASFVSRIWNRSAGGKVIGSAMLLVIVAGTTRSTFKLLEVGRGQYQEAIAHIQAYSQSPSVQVSGDHEFRNSTVLEFYESQNTTPRRISYQQQANIETPWYLVHSQDPNFAPANILNINDHFSFELVESYDSAPLSGWRWFLYQAPPHIVFGCSTSMGAYFLTLRHYSNSSKFDFRLSGN